MVAIPILHMKQQIVVMQGKSLEINTCLFLAMERAASLTTTIAEFFNYDNIRSSCGQVKNVDYDVPITTH